MAKNNFEEYKISKDTFIGGWYLPEHIVDGLTNYFEDEKLKGNSFEGQVFDAVTNKTATKKEHKDCEEVSVNPENFSDPRIHKYVDSVTSLISKYEEKYPHLTNTDTYGLKYTFNIQRYPIDGGYKSWHWERGSRGRQSSRLLVFMTYLNDVPFGGTEFYYQQLQVQAQKGLTLIWPAEFTHVHRGVVSNDTVKTIATGWFNYLEAEEDGTNL